MGPTEKAAAFPEVEKLCADVVAGSRAALGRAITLLESAREADRARADALLSALLEHPRENAIRIGITGSPGVGKSTLIEAFGRFLTNNGHRVAVLAVDPSSTRTGGSILGDKTRMTELARDQNAFIRPSPSGGTLGGVARRTRESVVACEAAGFDVVLIETVGVGQSEAVVASMVDFFLVLVLPGGGDELQGIKRGILELVDLLVVTKADGANVEAARRARHQYASALQLIPPRTHAWTPEATTCSALTGEGMAEIWDTVCKHRDVLTANGLWLEHRSAQNVAWMWRALETGLLARLHSDPAVATKLATLEPQVRGGQMGADRAAAALLGVFLPGGGNEPDAA